jgi:hypothetical protein
MQNPHPRITDSNRLFSVIDSSQAITHARASLVRFLGGSLRALL